MRGGGSRAYGFKAKRMIERNGKVFVTLFIVLRCLFYEDFDSHKVHRGHSLSMSHHESSSHGNINHGAETMKAAAKGAAAKEQKTSEPQPRESSHRRNRAATMEESTAGEQPRKQQP
jgi:hypothetical protein